MARGGHDFYPTAVKQPLIIGHRGFPVRFPDNSLEGVRAAIEAGADGAEVDVRLSAEGVWVCHHDRTRGGRKVASLPLAELRGQGVPSLAAVVETLPPSATLFVEVKPLARQVFHRTVETLLRLLEPRLERTMILSSSLSVLVVVGTLLPHLACSWVVNRLPAAVPPGLHLSPHHRLVEDLLPAGVALHPWTVNAAARIAQLAALGVASITTNRPDRAVEVLRG